MILEILSKIGFDWHLAIANTVNFALIFFVLQKYFFNPIDQSIESRKKMIEDSQSFHERAEEELAKASDEKNKILTEAHKKARTVMEGAEKKGEEILEHYRNEAKSESQKIIDMGKDAVQRKEKESLKRIQDEAANLIVSGAEKLVAQDFSDEVKLEYVKKASHHIKQA